MTTYEIISIFLGILTLFSGKVTAKIYVCEGVEDAFFEDYNKHNESFLVRCLQTLILPDFFARDNE